jgi:hypothetical protein
MMAPFTPSGMQHYADAMRYAGPEALARLSVADRIADAEREAMIAAFGQGRARTRPVLLSFGALLVRLGERMEAAAAPCSRHEYA